MIVRSLLAYDFASSARTYDMDGRLHVATSHISKANVCIYMSHEIPDFETFGLPPGNYRVWRHPDSLRRATRTFNNIPILSHHVEISALNSYPELVVGSTGTDAAFNAPYLDNSLVFWTQRSIDDVTSGRKEQLSPAYRWTPWYAPSVTPDGERFDFIMTDIIGNHVAQCGEGRTGADVRVAA